MTDSSFFEYVYNSDRFKNILDKLSCDLKLTEDEILNISNAIVDAYRIDGAKLYVNKYSPSQL